MNDLSQLLRAKTERASIEKPVLFGESVFSKLLLEYAERDNRICYVGVDTMDPIFAQRFPDRAFDVGICEQDEMTFATGLAKAGLVPVVQAWSPFTPIRNFDQLRTSLARHRANVKIITTATGLANCSHGATHHDMESVGLFRIIPNMTVVAPMDERQFEQSFHVAMAHDGPVVIMAPPLLYAPGEESADWPESVDHDVFRIGGSEWLRTGRHATIVAFGPSLHYAWQAAIRLAKSGLDIGVLNMYSLKPLDHSEILRAIVRTGVLVSVEEQSIIGGLGSAVAEVIAESGQAVRFKRLGIPDQFVEDVGDWTQTREGIGLTIGDVCACVQSLCAEPLLERSRT